MRSFTKLTSALLVAGAVASGGGATAVHAGAQPTAQAAADRWCETARIRYGRGWGWPSGSDDLSCRQIVDRSRALALRNVRPRGWRCSRWRARNGQWFGDCVRGRSYYGVQQPH
jgi:hypothetical protein